MTVAEMIAEIDSIIGEHHDRVIFDREKIKWLDRAYQYYCLKIKETFEWYFVTTSNISFVADQREYALPSNFENMKYAERVLDTGTIPMKKFTRNEEVNSTIEASSEFIVPDYDFEGQNIVFEPTPATDETDAVKLTYVKTLTPLILPTDSPDAGFISTYHHLLPLRAAISSNLASENTKRELSEWEETFKESLENRSVSRQAVVPWGLPE